MSKKFEDFFAGKRMVGLSQQNIPVKLNDRVVGSADVKEGVATFTMQSDAEFNALMTQPDDTEFSIRASVPKLKNSSISGRTLRPELLGSAILSPFGAPDTPRDTMFKSPDYPALAKKAVEMDWRLFHEFVVGYIPKFPSKAMIGMQTLNKLCAISPEFAERMNKWCDLNDEDPEGTKRMVARVLEYTRMHPNLPMTGVEFFEKIKEFEVKPAFVIDSLSVDEQGKVHGKSRHFTGDTKVAMRPLAEAIRRSGSVEETGAILDNHISGDLHVFFAVEAMIGEEKIYGKFDLVECRMHLRRIVSQLLKVPGLRKGKVLSLIESVTKAFATANGNEPDPEYATTGLAPVVVTADNIWNSFCTFNKEIRNRPPRHLPLILAAMVEWLKEAGFQPISVEEAYMEHKR